MNKHLLRLMLVVFIALVVSGCARERTSKKPPIHLNPNMDTQQKYKPFRESKFFADGLSMRKPVEGTVASGDLREDTEYYTGMTGPEKYVEFNPVKITAEFLDRGQERYNIFCAPCHGQVGDGKGIVTKYAYPIPPTDLHDARIRQAEDGYLYNIITNGIRNMPPYDHQIPVEDRWAIVSYVRALQVSQNARADLIPEEKRTGLKQ